MEICGFAFLTLVFHWFQIQLLSVLLIFCTKKKLARAEVRNPTTQGATVAATTGDQKTTPGGGAPAKPEGPKSVNDDDDEVKFNINIKKTEEKKDEFDDDEENPLAKIAVKPRNKNAPGKKGATGPAGKAAEKANAKNKTKEDNLERPFLAPNEKQYGVSCYQFEPTQPQVPASQQVPVPLAPAPPPPPSATLPTAGPAPPIPPKKPVMQKSGDGCRTTVTRTIATAAIPAAATPIPTPAVLPNADNANTKSTLSLTTNKKTKTIEQERTNNHDNNLEKTQKCEGEK